jgi:replicative superfamily II helicase
MSDLISLIEAADSLNYDSTFSVYQACAKQLMREEGEGIRLIINVLHARHKFDRSLDAMLADLVEAVGFYPYLQREKLELTSTSSMLRMGGNHSEHINERVFHDEQKIVLNLLKEDKNVVVSAPTSFGKSLLIEEMVASRKFHNIVIVQPTLALLDETRRKLNKYRDFYKIILRTSQLPDENNGNIFLLTSERVNEYQSFPKIDFLVIDEFYKLSARRDDERSDSLNNALLYLLRTFKPQFYLAGPNIDGVSEEFLKRYSAIFFITSYSLVATEVVNVHANHIGSFGVSGYKKTFKEKILFELLDALSNEQTLVYCSSPRRARSLARSYLNYRKNKEHIGRNLSLPIYK